MQIHDFPPIIYSQINNNMNAQINDAKYANRNRINEIESLRKSDSSGSGVRSGAIIGFIAGFGACACRCYDLDKDMAFTYASNPISLIGSCLLLLLIIEGIGVFVGYLIDRSLKSSYNNNELMISTKLNQENESLARTIQTIEANAAKEKQEYLSQFELEAQRISVQLAESQLAKKVIEWMTDGFCRTIDAADRRKHIEQVSVPFQFEVYTNKITCNLGTFDFEIERCENLNGPLEQTALARAIASSIQLNIVMKYPKDASGTDIQIKIEYQYTDKCPKTIITYVAPNGYYETVQKW